MSPAPWGRISSASLVPRVNPRRIWANTFIWWTRGAFTSCATQFPAHQRGCSRICNICSAKAGACEVTSRWYLSLAVLAAMLALGVIVLGAYVRLSQAGLGCPDWPGCYGHLSVPETHAAVARADALYAGQPLHAARAWKEMIHRYFAGSLGVLILILALAAWWLRIVGRARNLSASGSGPAAGVQAVILPSLALLTVIFQALLGMWTVTL